MSHIVYKSGRLGWHVVAFIALVLMFGSSVRAAPKADLIEFWDDSEPTSTMQVNHDAWQEILSAYVDDEHQSGINRFDYSAVTLGDARKLKTYLAYLQQLDPRQLNSEEAKAFWINMFNAIQVERIVETYQNGSKRAINRLLDGRLRSGSRWSRDAVEVAMQVLSLNDIEHGILRPIWNDSRMHFAMISCSLGGANIQKTAFNGENIEALMEKAKIEFLQHPRAIRIQGSKLILNTVFDWYAADFGSNRQAVLTYLRNNVDAKTREAMQGLSRVSYEYSWDLNAPSR